MVNEGNPILEETFSSIEKGYVLEKKEEYWKATHAFFKAHGLLKQLAGVDSASCNDDRKVENSQDAAATDSTDTSAEQEKVLKLYRQQADQYFHKSRQTLIKALQDESEHDKKQQADDQNMNSVPEHRNSVSSSNSLTDEEVQDRLLVFASLFGREDDVMALRMMKDRNNKASSATHHSQPVDDQQMSLEERLLALNKSLPSAFKTSEERMRDINQGLNKLGFKLYSSTDNSDKRLLLDVAPKSETEQVDDIIAQAKDEVIMSQQHPLAGGAANNNICVGTNSHARLPSTNDVFLDDAGDSDLLDEDEWNDGVDDEDNFDLAKEDLVAIRDKVNEAQSSLAQLNTLLAAVCDKGEEDEDITNTNSDDVTFDQRSAKKALRDARVHLQLATQRWREVYGD
ncbi:hypothetical protein ACA910_016961 [Epithemia clementina (nom. ined.)]